MELARAPAEPRGSSGVIARTMTIHEEVCANGHDTELNSFVQSYGSKWLDGSLLLIPTTGFLPPDDPRIIGTVQAVERSHRDCIQVRVPRRMFGIFMTATRVMCGAASLRISSHFPTMVCSKIVKPVMLPPG
jgi:hypothetical protein